MLSRVADSVYWMNRYIERAENIARTIDVALRMSLDLPPDLGEQWRPLIEITADTDLFEARYKTCTREHVTRFLTFDDAYPNSILACLRAARENARTVREVISTETWEQVNAFYLMVCAAAADQRLLETPSEFLSRVRTASHLFIGIVETTMSHGEAWHFSRVGRMLERADKTTRILDVKYFVLLPSVGSVGSSYDAIQWAALLRSVSAFEMYRKKYHVLQPNRVAEFLLLDREFPRAVHHALSTADYSLHAITRTPTGSFTNAAEQCLGQLRSELTYQQIDAIVARGVHEFLDDLQGRINTVGDRIHETFFA